MWDLDDPHLRWSKADIPALLLESTPLELKSRGQPSAPHSLSLHSDLKQFLLFLVCFNFILETGSHCVAHPGLKLSILLSQSAKC